MNWDILSRRERQIVNLITGEQCMTSGQIGEVLGISPRTIESHRLRIFKKLNVKNMVELTRLVLLPEIRDPTHSHPCPGCDGTR